MKVLFIPIVFLISKQVCVICKLQYFARILQTSATFHVNKKFCLLLLQPSGVHIRETLGRDVVAHVQSTSTYTSSLLGSGDRFCRRYNVQVDVRDSIWPTDVGNSAEASVLEKNV